MYDFEATLTLLRHDQTSAKALRDIDQQLPDMLAPLDTAETHTQYVSALCIAALTALEHGTPKTYPERRAIAIRVLARLDWVAGEGDII